jgi:hypothetical protein
MAAQTILRIVLWEMDARSEGYFFRFTCADTDHFHSVVALVRGLPLWTREYNRDQKCWWISDEVVSELARKVPELAAHLGLPHGGQQQEQQQGEQKQPIPLVPAKVAAAFQELTLTDRAPDELVAAARKVYACLLHSDRAGGDHALMVAKNNAADIIEGWRKAQRTPGRKEGRYEG